MEGMAGPRKHVSRCIAMIRALRARFDAAHTEGLAALHRHDFAALSEAVRREEAIIREQATLIDEQHLRLAELREQVVFDRLSAGWPPNQ
jgi:hypothetical protein